MAQSWTFTMQKPPSLDILLSQTPALVGIASTDGKFVRVSKAWSSFLGLPVEAIEGSDFLQYIHPDDVQQTIDALSVLDRNTPILGFENRYKTASGDYHNLVWRSDKGPDDLIYFTAEDVTEAVRLRTSLEASNERLKQVAEIAGIGGWVVDLVNKTVFWDETTRRIHEVPDDFIPTLEQGVAFYDGEAAQIIGNAVQNGIENQQPWNLVLPLITYTGRRIFVRASGKPLVEDGIVTRLTGTFQDVTEAQEHNARLEMSRKEAEAANEAKSRFLANMSHEIRTPLNGVLGMAQLLQRTSMTEKQTFYLKTLTESGGALVSLINDVLDLSRIEAGELALLQEPFDLAELISNSRSAVAAQAAQKGLLVNLNTSHGLPHTVIGDSARLKQVLINLLGNAVKFTDLGQITLKIDPRGDNRIRFSIIDTGPGIPDAMKGVIFERFTQIDESNTRRQGGTGLGLAICRDLVHLAGGKLGVEDTPGGGATFWFEWPLPTAQSDMQESAEAGAHAGMHVLIAEDNAINAMMLQEALGASGYKVIHAQNGREAVERALAKPPDLIIMDVHMPELNGFEALKLIRESCDRIVPVFVLSADVTPQTRATAEGLEVEAFLTKPVNIDALMEAVDGVTGKQAA
jgi:signal transduction histidine kinase/CheY-like chemotaxis protein